ncbi:9315_t:CDS:2 [Diversispora eburnea]|uniref:9315_t:CDS:1 n=1 Tax=Diversispora eburnea TaxID=1213867 RepID=A0A9N8WG21_9GLOM|nr:9315_t:CDS:2 [Diversispora eburnea]
MDQRSKPRKRTQDAVHRISNNQPPLVSKHPAIGMISEFCLRILKECSKSDQKSKLSELIKQDVQSLPQQLMIISKGFPIYAKVNPVGCEKMLPELFKTVFSILEVDNSEILIACTNCLSELIINGISDTIIQQKLEQMSESNKELLCLDIIIKTVEDGFKFRYQVAWFYVLEISKSLFQRLHRSSETLLINLVKIVDDIRMNPSFKLKEEADQTLGIAIANMAWLLPLLKDHISNTKLEYFFQELIPLADRLGKKSLEYQDQNMMIGAKVYDTLMHQVWALLPGFCNLPIDLSQTFTKVTAELFSNVMYQKPEFRSIIVHALKNLVEKNITILNSEEDDEELFKKYNINKMIAKHNIDHMKKYSANYLAVFFNIFSQTLPAHRVYLLNVIKVYLDISPAKEISITFGKVMNLLKQSLSDQLQSTETNTNNQNSPPPMSYTMLDLLIAMTPHLDVNSIKQLYEVIITLLSSENSTLQKKAYKELNKIVECENGKIVILQNIEDLQDQLLNTIMASNSASKKDRLLMLSNTIKLLPNSDLHMIPEVLSEVILCTKEVNEKARINAYELLIVMGNKMKEGGNINMNKISDANPESPNMIASINEFIFGMVVAGLAASTPHMISATIASLSRLIFEFKDDLDKQNLHELIDTMDNFVNSKNREIVKAVLGFVKVIVVSLDVDFLNLHLSQIIPGILIWSNEHKNHFKSKVRHIFERLLRRFEYEMIEKHVSESDKKFLEDEDTPIDFLDKGIMSKVIGTNPITKNKSKRDILSSFKESRDGRLMIKESDEESLKDFNDSEDVIMQEAENNHLEAQRSSDGFTRDGIESIDAITSRRKKNKPKRKNDVVIIGKEYKAKKAGGDIKKKGKPDPYEYIPLTSVYKKKGQRGTKFVITRNVKKSTKKFK